MELSPGVHRIDGVKGAHVYFFARYFTLVDTGLPGQEQLILRYLARSSVKPGQLKYVVLTHYDVDHVGSAAALKALTGAKVCAHSREVPYIEGRRPRPGIKRLLPWLTAPLFGRLKPVAVDIPVSGDYNLEGIKLLETPGHTPGHLCAALDKVVMVGDLLQGGVKEAPQFFIWNHKLAKESLKKLAAFKPELILPGHGNADYQPQDKLNRLIDSLN